MRENIFLVPNDNFELPANFNDWVCLFMNLLGMDHFLMFFFYLKRENIQFVYSYFCFECLTNFLESQHEHGLKIIETF